MPARSFCFNPPRSRRRVGGKLFRAHNWIRRSRTGSCAADHAKRFACWPTPPPAPPQSIREGRMRLPRRAKLKGGQKTRNLATTFPPLLWGDRGGRMPRRAGEQNRGEAPARPPDA